MARFLLDRIVQAIVVLFVMSFAVYGLIGLMPGDPIDLMLSADPRLTPADVERLKALHGLDRPIVERWLAWLGGALSGELGYSRLFARPVLDVLAGPLVNTVVLMGLAFLVAVLIGIPAGIAAAARPHSRIDYTVNFLCFAGISVPPFWLALLLMMLFAVWLGWLPAVAVPASEAPSLGEHLRHLALPVATLAMLSAGGIARHTRAAMRETLRRDYVRTARAKGLSEAGVLVRHAFRNAMIPVVTILALDVGALFSGALITEIMFGYPGMGRLLYDAIMGNDYNLALVGLMFATGVTLAANLAADATYAAIDPRVSFGRGDTG